LSGLSVQLGFTVSFPYICKKDETMIQQVTIELPPYKRGYHLITSQITSNLPPLPESGLIHIFLKHTSAGISLNENADGDVRRDFEAFLNKLIPENDPVYTHTLEGSDDMPAHLKSSLIGQQITVPIVNHRPGLGTWQGIYLCEFRNYGGHRNIVLTIVS